MNKSNIYLTPKQTVKIPILKIIDYFSLPLIVIGISLFIGFLILFTTGLTIGIGSGILVIPIIILYYFYSPYKSKIGFIAILYLISAICAGILYLYLSDNPYKNILSNYYEGFQTNQSININTIRKKTEELQKALDKLELISEDTCVVLNSIESKFMDNATVPQTDESNLSEITKQSMKEKRIAKAKQDWINKKSEYSASNNGFVGKECFIDNNEYQEAIQELKDLLNSSSVINLDSKINNLTVTNKFSINYANKFAKEASNILNITESFQTTLSNDPAILIKQANEIIQKIEKTNEILQEAKTASTTISSLTSNPNTISNILTNPQ